SLSTADRDALSSHLVEVSLFAGQALFEPGDKIESVYFPGSACVSLVTVLHDGKTVETSTVGRESAVCLLDALAEQSSRSRVFAQIGGGAMRIPASVIR